MNARIQSLMAALRKDHLPICIEKLRIALRTMAATEGEPMILRRAKVFANVLREIPIFIEEDALIVGNGASKPMGLEIDPEYFIWSQDEIDALKREGFLISPEDERELQELNAGRKSKTLIGSMGEAAAHDERLLNFLRLESSCRHGKALQRAVEEDTRSRDWALAPGSFSWQSIFARC